MSSPVHLDTVFDVLANYHRRRLLVALLEHNPQEAVVVPNEEPPEDSEVERLDVAMVHVHLPKLEETGFVTWDPKADEVEKGPRFENLRPLLECVDDFADE